MTTGAQLSARIKNLKILISNVEEVRDEAWEDGDAVGHVEACAQLEKYHEMLDRLEKQLKA